MGLVKRFTYEQVRNLERQPNQVKGSFALVSNLMGPGYLYDESFNIYTVL